MHSVTCFPWAVWQAPYHPLHLYPRSARLCWLFPLFIFLLIFVACPQRAWLHQRSSSGGFFPECQDPGKTEEVTGKGRSGAI